MQRIKKIISIGGGKGGTGKTFMAANLGVHMASMGKKVIVVDLNIGAPNLHAFLGINLPTRSLREFFNDKYENLHSLLIQSPYSDIQLISGGSDVLGFATLAYSQKQRLLRGLKSLNCEILILDIPSGLSADSLDWFLFAPGGVCVLDPQPPALESSFHFIKNAVYKIIIQQYKNNPESQKLIEEAVNARSRLNVSTVEELIAVLDELNPASAGNARQALADYHPSIVVNNIKTDIDADIGSQFKALVKKYLGIDIIELGNVAQDKDFTLSIGGKMPYVVFQDKTSTSRDIKSIACKLIQDL